MKLIGRTIIGACLLSLLLACGKSGSPRADGVGNGGGLGEKNVLLAFKKLPESVSECLSSVTCGLTESESALLGQIHRALVDRREVEAQLVFLGENERPGFFEIVPGKVRSARTGDNVGDPIYVNVGHLYSPGPITLSAATSLLVHELARHQGLRGEAPEVLRELHSLGAKVAASRTRLESEGQPLPTVRRILVCDPRHRIRNELGRAKAESPSPFLYVVSNVPAAILPATVPGFRPDVQSPRVVYGSAVEVRSSGVVTLTASENAAFQAMGTESCHRIQYHAHNQCLRSATSQSAISFQLGTDPCNPTPTCLCDAYVLSNDGEASFFFQGRMTF